MWHRLTINPDTGAPYLSSRRLIVLVEKLPETSELKTAARDGRWDLKTRLLAESFNEQLRMRQSYHAAHSTDEVDVRFDPEPYFFVDPVVAKALEAQEKLEAEIAAQTEPELADAGWM